MQSYTSYYNYHEELFKKYLTTIQGVKFTFREIDIIACILNNRGEKKIAIICGISPTTVSTHSRNIMIKIACNSKDQIIDFIEKSGTLKIFKEYYLHLLIKSYFAEALMKIARQINVKYYHLKNTSIKNLPLYSIIQNHLSQANIKLSTDKGLSSTIDFQSVRQESYYQDFFQVLLQLYNNEKIHSIYSDFQEKCNALEKENDINSPIYIKYSFKEFFKHYQPYHKIAISGLLIFSLLLVLFIIYLNPLFTNNNNLLQAPPTFSIIQNLEELLSDDTIEQFTANNIDKDKVNKNQSRIKNIEKILDYKNMKEVQDYFDRAEMSSDVLIRYLHTLHALTSYLMYNENDDIKSKNTLLHAKKIAEHYVQRRNKNTIDFDSLSTEELLSELEIIAHLPQVYARIIYSLGRTYIYTDKPEDGLKYFELSKNLGLKLNLFDGYLSELRGFLPIKIAQIEQAIKVKNNNIASLTLQIKQIIASFNILKNDNNSYVLDYNPLFTKQNKIVPGSHEYNVLHCDCNIINMYNLLIKIDSDSSAIESYIEAINTIIDNQQTFRHYIKKADNIAPRKKAFLYIVLGNVMLTLWDKGYHHNKIQQTIAQNLQIKSINILDLSEKFFIEAKVVSRATDYTKADSYGGLINVYQRKLLLNHITIKHKEELLDKIKDYTNERNLINQTLHRKA